VTLRRNISSVIVWSIISAAFIGPGTVTTAATAGALFHLDLLWAVAFSTLACVLLQEVSARLAIVSGLTMGQALIRRHGPTRGKWLNLLLGGPVILGCAAYEAGNILGAVSGIQLLRPASTHFLTTALTLVVGIILWTGKREAIGYIMTILVGLMGVAFFLLAADLPYSLSHLFRAAIVPTIPHGSELIVLALVGTTIVPYNVFLGSGVSKGQTVPLMRLGLVISVVIGGLITSAILVAGTAASSFSSFAELAQSLQANLGTLGALALGMGLFAAGFSSTITSPFAASVIASTVFSQGKAGQRWTWISVLSIGFVVGISGAKPIPVILLVQALNGLVLPLLTAFLILLINDRVLIPPSYRPSHYYNGLLLIIFGAVLMMGLHSIDKSLSTWFGLSQGHYGAIAVATFVTTAFVGYRLIRSNVKGG